MSRAWLALLVAVVWVLTYTSAWSLIWRVPVAVVIGVFALICFLLDDAVRALRRLTHHRR